MHFLFTLVFLSMYDRYGMGSISEDIKHKVVQSNVSSGLIPGLLYVL